VWPFTTSDQEWLQATFGPNTPLVAVGAQVPISGILESAGQDPASIAVAIGDPNAVLTGENVKFGIATRKSSDPTAPGQILLHETDGFRGTVRYFGQNQNGPSSVDVNDGYDLLIVAFDSSDDFATVTGISSDDANKASAPVSPITGLQGVLDGLKQLISSLGNPIDSFTKAENSAIIILIIVLGVFFYETEIKPVRRLTGK
jgi:hypothetical protein